MDKCECSVLLAECDYCKNLHRKSVDDSIRVLTAEDYHKEHDEVLLLRAEVERLQKEKMNTRPVENALKDDLIVAMRERNDAMIRESSLRAALKELVFISEYMNHIEWRVRSDNERFDPPMRWDKAIAKAKEVIGNGTP